jgi:hypothetical protein
MRDDLLCCTDITGDSIAVQIGAFRVEPRLGASGFGTEAFNQVPKAGGVIHFDQVCDLVRGKIFEYERRREYQAP